MPSAPRRPPRRPDVQVAFQTQDATDHVSITIAPGARGALAAIALVLLAIIAAAPAINGKFLPQDDTHVTANNALRLWKGLIPIWLTPQRMESPSPVTFTSYLIQYKLFGTVTTGYHAVSIVLHAIAVLLLWTLLRKLDLPGAWLAAGLFAVHPVAIASVAWIAQQKVLLCAAFYLSALLLYFRYCGINPEIPREVDDYRAFVPRLPQSRGALYALSILLLLLGLASQALAVTFVPVVLAVIWWKRGEVRRRGLQPLILPALITIVAAIAFAVIEWRHGARGSDFPSLLQRVQLTGHVLWFDLLNVLAPIRLSYVYPRWTLSAASIWQYLPTLAAIGALIALWRMRHTVGRGPVAAALLFVILVLPYAGIVNFRWMRQSYVGDHLIYLASAIPLIAIATVVARHLQHALWRQVAATSLIAVLLVFSIGRAREYRDERSLWTATLARNGRSLAAHNALGRIALDDQKDTAAAFRHFTAALEIDDQNLDTHLNLARLYELTNQIDLAMGEWQQVLRLDPRNVDARFGMAEILKRQGDSRGAIVKYREVLALNPDHAPAYFGLGQLHEDRNELDDAIRCYRKAIEIDPRFVSPRSNLGVLLFNMGRLNEAADELRTIVERIDPNYYIAWFNLGAITGTLSQQYPDSPQQQMLLTKSAEYFAGAAKLNPESFDAFMGRGKVLMRHSRLRPREPAMQMISEAIACFNRAARLRPDSQEASQLAEAAQAERQRRQDLRDEPHGTSATSPAR